MTEGMEANVLVDIPCNVQQVDETGFVWTFLEEARDPSLITEGAIVIAADEVDPIVAHVVSLTSESNGTVVRLKVLPGEPLEYAEALARAGLLSA